MNSALQAVMFAVECLLASGIVLAAAFLATRTARLAASRRHLVWLTAFGALLLLPLAICLIPSHLHILHHAMPAAMPAAADMQMAPAADPAPVHDLFVRVIFAVWFAGFAAVALRGAVGAFGLCMLYRRSVPYFLEGVDARKLEVAGRRWKLRLSTMPGGAGPVTWGIFRPIVLLPKAAVLWPRDKMEAVLLHELAHVRRHDCLTQALALAVCAFYWPNPLAWIAARALRREAEMAADDAVIVSGVKPSSYAGQLLDLAAEFRFRRSYALSMAAPSALEARVQSVLAPMKPRAGVTAMDALKFAGAGLVAVSLLALVRPSFADDDIPPPPAPPSVLPAVPAMPAPPPEMAQMPDAPPAPPAAPAAPPAPPAPPHLSQRHMHHVIWTDESGKHVIRFEVPDTSAIMARVRPQIEAAVRQARIEEDKAHVVDHEQVEAAIARARDDEARARVRAHAEIERAMAHADAEIARAQAEIERARARHDGRVVIINRDEDE